VTPNNIILHARNEPCPLLLKRAGKKRGSKHRILIAEKPEEEAALHREKGDSSFTDAPLQKEKGVTSLSVLGKKALISLLYQKGKKLMTISKRFEVLESKRKKKKRVPASSCEEKRKPTISTGGLPTTVRVLKRV